MNETAIRLIKDAVLRALQKSPADVAFYRAKQGDPHLPPAYRQALQQALQQALDEWDQIQKFHKC